MALSEKELARQEEVYLELKSKYEELKREKKRVQDQFGISDDIINMGIEALSKEDQNLIKLLEAEAIRQSQEPKISAATVSRSSVSSVRRNSMRI